MSKRAAAILLIFVAAVVGCSRGTAPLSCQVQILGESDAAWTRASEADELGLLRLQGGTFAHGECPELELVLRAFVVDSRGLEAIATAYCSMEKPNSGSLVFAHEVRADSTGVAQHAFAVAVGGANGDFARGAAQQACDLPATFKIASSYTAKRAVQLSNGDEVVLGAMLFKSPVVIATEPQVQSLDDILKQSDAQVAVVNWFEKFKTSRDAAALRKDLSGHALVFATAAVVKDSHFQRVQQIISERELSPKP